MPRPEKPNFVLIVTDQQRADHLGCYGNDIVRTPHIDSIAARGLAFDRFYVASPICMPNRATIMTGKMPSANGVPTNGLPLPLEAVTFVDLLRADGYRTALAGKCHLQNMMPIPVDESNYPPPPPGRPPPAALAESLRRPVSGPGYDAEMNDLWIADPDRAMPSPYYGFDDVRLAIRHADDTQGHYTRWLLQRTNDPDALRGPENALDRGDIVAPQAWRTRMPEELYSTSYIREAGIELLEDFARTPDRPFFLQYSFSDPHHPFTPPGRYWSMYDPDDIPVPASHGAEHVDPSALWRRFHRDLEDGVARREHVHPYALSAREAQESIALTYGMITMIDDAVGALLARLEELGLADNTVLMFTTDHGDLMGDHGLMLKHGFHYEGLIRVPFIWSEPGGGPNGDKTGRSDLLSGSIDIGATVLGRAGLAPPNGNRGFDLITAARSGTPVRDAILIEEEDLPVNSNVERYMRLRTLVTGRWRLTFWDGEPLGELFDREEDPLELRNLWNDPAASGVKADLMERMLRESLRHQDMGPKAEY
ncbi:MAG: sulfatase-like hydrolase/transferase, partial [Rhodospirillaceae bacterium]|nr:sulfatase-like hydrolase/transferase [Rhodospirillaceae bacterium]